MNTRCTQHTPRRSGCSLAFTLVELLVVIGIIAVLIGILLPALSRARESSRTVACLSNLRSIGQANYLYAAENKGWCVPCAYRSGSGTAGPYGDWTSWYSILVDAGYLTAPDATGKGPQSNSVLFCPSANPDQVSAATSSAGSSAIPASDTDMQGAEGTRRTSPVTGVTVDCWYGINGSTGKGDIGVVPLIRLPADSQVDDDYTAATKMTMIPYSASMVFVFDGIYMNLNVNSARINSRHSFKQKTNLVFFDGHAATYDTKELPGGNLANGQGGLFTKAYLDANFPSPAPKWVLTQY